MNYGDSFSIISYTFADDLNTLFQVGWRFPIITPNLLFEIISEEEMQFNKIDHADKATRFGHQIPANPKIEQELILNCVFQGVRLPSTNTTKQESWLSWTFDARGIAYLLLHAL